jgi:hypothetical protein
MQNFGPQLFILIRILIFMLLRSPCKNSEPYNNPIWGFEQERPENIMVNGWYVISYRTSYLFCNSYGSEINVISYQLKEEEEKKGGKNDYQKWLPT